MPLPYLLETRALPMCPVQTMCGTARSNRENSREGISIRLDQHLRMAKAA
jgi:hypothetical protein